MPDLRNKADKAAEARWKRLFDEADSDFNAATTPEAKADAQKRKEQAAIRLDGISARVHKRQNVITRHKPKKRAKRVVVEGEDEAAMQFGYAGPSVTAAPAVPTKPTKSAVAVAPVEPEPVAAPTPAPVIVRPEPPLQRPATQNDVWESKRRDEARREQERADRLSGNAPILPVVKPHWSTQPFEPSPMYKQFLKLSPAQQRQYLDAAKGTGPLARKLAPLLTEIELHRTMNPPKPEAQIEFTPEEKAESARRVLAASQMPMPQRWEPTPQTVDSMKEPPMEWGPAISVECERKQYHQPPLPEQMHPLPPDNTPIK